MVSKPSSFVLVVGHGPQLESEDGVVSVLRALGAAVRTMDLWDDFGKIVYSDDDAIARAIVFESGERPDLAMTALRAARKELALGETPAILAVPARQVAQVEPSAGFDDF